MVGAAIVGPEYHHAFRNISGFDTTNEFLCQECIEHLDAYFNYREKVQESHRSFGYEPSVFEAEPEAPMCPHCPYTSHSPGQLKKHIAKVHQLSLQDEPLCNFIKKEQADVVLLRELDFDPIKTEIKTEVIDETQTVTVSEKARAGSSGQNQVAHSPQKERVAAPIRMEVSELFVESAPSIEKSDPNTFTDYLKCKDCNKLITPEELFDQRKQIIEAAKHLYKCKAKRKKINPEDDVKVSCPTCSKEMRKSQLEQHIGYKHRKKNYMCQYCSKSFISPSRLRYHLNEHEGSLPFECDLCDFSCNLRFQISNHIRRFHLNIPYWQCPICQRKMFSRQNTLQQHLKKYHPGGKHNGMRVNPATNYFDCAKCGASYTNVNWEQSHSCKLGRVQVKCPVCKIPRKNLETLHEHLLKSHPKVS